MKSYTSTTSTQFDNEFMFKEGVRHWRYNPRTKGASVMRVVPAIVNGKPTPMISPSSEISEAAISDAFTIVETVSFFGNKDYSMICPGPVEGERVGMVHHFVYYLQDFYKSNPRSCPSDWMRWQGIRDEGDRETPKRIINRPTQTLLMQGYLLEHAGELCMDKTGDVSPKWPVVMCLAVASARKDLLTKIMTPADVNAPWSSANNNLGDILDLQNGRKLAIIPYPTKNNNVPQTWYKVEAQEVMPLSLEDAEAVWRPWEDILDLHPTIDEIGIRLASTFDATSVLRVFADCPVYSQVCKNQFLLEMADREAAATKTTTGYRPPVQPSWETPAAPPVKGSPSGTPKMPTFPPEPEEEPEGVDHEVPETPQAPTDPAAAMEARIAALRKQVGGGGAGTPSASSAPSKPASSLRK